MLDEISKLEAVSLRTLADLVRSQDTRLQELENGEKAPPKSENRFRREILESPAISTMEKLYDNKNYRQWLERFKNVMEQARPGGSKVITYLGQLKDKEIHDVQAKLVAEDKLGVTPEMTIRTMLLWKQEDTATLENTTFIT